MQLCNIYQSLQQIHDKEELEHSGKRLSPRTKGVHCRRGVDHTGWGVPAPANRRETVNRSPANIGVCMCTVHVLKYKLCAGTSYICRHMANTCCYFFAQIKPDIVLGRMLLSKCDEWTGGGRQKLSPPQAFSATVD